MTISEGDGSLLGRLCLLAVMFVFVVAAFGVGFNAGRHGAGKACLGCPVDCPKSCPEKCPKTCPCEEKK